MNYHCHHTQFDILAKGVQVRYEHNNSRVTQFFPFTQILSLRHDYNHDDKINTITFLLCDGLKYSYHSKHEDHKSTYEKIVEAMNAA
jgi:hypothetical protein